MPTVLIVEDEYILALDLQRVLAQRGFTVLGPSGTVAHALNLIRQVRPDAAVLDLTLGGEKVTPVAHLLKSLGVPFLLATASDAAELARHPVFADITNVGKPTDSNELVQGVHDLIRKCGASDW